MQALSNDRQQAVSGNPIMKLDYCLRKKGVINHSRKFISNDFLLTEIYFPLTEIIFHHQIFILCYWKVFLRYRKLIARYQKKVVICMECLPYFILFSKFMNILQVACDVNRSLTITENQFHHVAIGGAVHCPPSWKLFDQFLADMGIISEKETFYVKCLFSE